MTVDRDLDYLISLVYELRKIPINQLEINNKCRVIIRLQNDMNHKIHNAKDALEVRG